MVSLMVYAMIPFRTHGARTPVTPSASAPGNVSIAATGTGGQPQGSPPASASTSASAAGAASAAAKSVAPSAGHSAGTSQATAG